MGKLLKAIEVLFLSVLFIGLSFAEFALPVNANEKVEVMNEIETEVVPINLNTDYEKDFEELYRQIVDYNKEYKELIIKEEPTEEEYILLEMHENDMRVTAEELLSIRYTDNKESLDPEMLNTMSLKGANQQEITPLSITSTRNFTTGDYGFSRKEGAGSNAWFEHGSRLNRGYAYASSGQWNAQGITSSGVRVYPTRTGNGSFSISGVLRRAKLTCYQTTNSYTPIAIYQVKRMIYDATANSYSESTSINKRCNEKIGTETIDLGPTTITTNNYYVVAGRTYAIYLRTMVNSFAGKVDGGHGYGTRWQTISFTH